MQKKLTKKDLELIIAEQDETLKFCKALIKQYQTTIKVWTPLRSVKTTIYGKDVDLLEVRLDEPEVGRIKPD